MIPATATISTMSSIGKYKGRGRQTQGRKPKAERNHNEGIYNNPRVTHVGTTLIGCSVQIQVKNGKVFEGIFSTFSPKMDVVLELVHIVGETLTKDTMKEKIIFEKDDIVMLTAQDVDPDYATKDGFIDSAISSKHNGLGIEKELQRWDASEEAGDSLELESRESTNGWNAEDMFQINADKFQYRSSYNPDLTQYTTPLVKEDTEEYKERQMIAARQAKEIEGTEQHRKHRELENGDEEMAFSAVVRTTGSNPADKSSNGKYVPPQKRRQGAPGQLTRSGYPPSNGPASPNTTLPPTNKPLPPGPPLSVPSAAPPYHPTQQKPVSPTDQLNDQCQIDDRKLVRSENISPTDMMHPPPKEATRGTVDAPSPPITHKKEIQELKDFSAGFKLAKTTGAPSHPASVAPALASAPTAGPPHMTGSVHMGDEKPYDEEDKKFNDQVKKSTLNPNAKEFNPTAKPPSSRPTVTTPRSPAIPNVPVFQPVMYAPVLNHQPMVAPAPQPAPRYQATVNKKATVSLQRPEINNAAAAATGTPILAPAHSLMQQTHNQQFSAVAPGPYYQHQTGMPGPQAVYPMPVPQRMMTPPMVPAGQHMDNPMQPPAQPQGVPPSPQVLMGGVAVSNGHPMAGPPPHAGSAQPGHPHMPNHPQATPPHSVGPTPAAHPAAAGSNQHHPNPSPVPHHPPNSNTPQNHVMYNSNQSVITNPPLQPSPHTPTSPQYQPQYPYNSQPPPHQPIHTIQYSHSGPHPTVTHATHYSHSHLPQQIVMQPQNPHMMASVSQGGPPPNAVSVATAQLMTQGHNMYNNHPIPHHSMPGGGVQGPGQAGPGHLMPPQQLSLPQAAYNMQQHPHHPMSSQGPPSQGSHATFHHNQ